MSDSVPIQSEPAERTNPQKRRFDPASLAILKRLDELEILLQTKTNDPSPLALGDFPSTSPSGPSGQLSSPGTAERNPRKLPFITVETVLEWPVFDDCGFPRHFHLLNSLEENTHTRGPHISVDLGLHETDRLLRAFFDHVHIFNPTLEEEEVEEYVNTIRLNGIGWDAISCLLLLIYAHGSIATPFVKNGPGLSPDLFGSSKSFLQAEAYFSAAQKRMGPLLCTSGVIEAQCFFLAGVYLMSTLRPVAAWRMFVQALACCQGFSVQQRNESYESEPSTKERIYWTCFKSELELRLELNVSQTGILDLSYPTLFPSPPERLKSKDEATWYFYLAEIALRRLKNRILDSLYRHDMASPEFNIEHAIFDFEEQTDAW
ncbi:hypothetical protein N7448_007068 [Penicillium atrosanguineum]|nr:uncharacterized protein N7443_010830 [Penicillium atrosanguineum]KAJ5132910.1 hypothetical protein N7448_007068 [Penicillium atrosanguineum]KAJ5141200.1 hypothetical protein N7526_002195 [Penicillium atrosanguineum]KAJ5290577.1 hypothetical protein N7443_010830 [Penicillium atrosanguineum]